MALKIAGKYTIGGIDFTVGASGDWRFLAPLGIVDVT